ncbi:putative leucine-rich repeat-containing protein DDB_G0290503 [Tenebrio molitor]|jgi:hypothetical protein|uniref:putative leucine-rich repeat-containing protein DDB_G0290503 n=1 Tax=Tenebrio molitor TaxID=7067 RepID=UPI001C39E8AE|nr:unnamed protein product [Tenebrio molitor]
MKMSKRSIISKNVPPKKPRLDELNDFWDDDFDEDLIDDCFERATQAFNEEKNGQNNDVTLLTSYSIFKEREGLVASTQVAQNSTNNPDNLQSKIKELQNKCAEKEGEVSILRTNLHNLRASSQIDQEKKQKEWKEKFSTIEKENKGVKSELEFKNLEIANLKQQIAELSKFVKVEQNATQKSAVVNKTLGLSSPAEHANDLRNENFRINISSKKYFPLKYKDFSFLFKIPLESYTNINKHKLCKKPNSYLFKQVVKEENLTTVNKSITEEKHVDLGSVYSEISHLINLSQDDLDSETSIFAINKVLCASMQLLNDFHSYMKQIENNIQLQDVQESDALYLQNSNWSSPTEIGLECSEILRFLAEVLPYSTFLKKYLLQDQSKTNTKCLLQKIETETTPKLYYLTLLLNIVSVIGKTRREQICSRFLSGVIQLLCRLLNNEDFYSLDGDNVPFQIAKELLFLRPDFNVIVQITYFLKIITRNPSFIHFICSKPVDIILKKNESKGVISFSKDFCRFHMFVILLENVLLKTENEIVLSKISSNILNFVYNILKLNNSWLYQQEDKTCECLFKLYKLAIGIIYKNLKPHKDLDNKDRLIFKNSIKILNLLTFNSYDLTQKYVTEFAQFKEIVHTLIYIYDMDLENLKNLEKLSVAEDFPDVPSEKFIGLNL